MAGVNKVILIGRLGKDVELKTLSTDRVVGNFSLATSESYRNKAGEKVETTEWHNIVVWGKSAENVAKFAHKGDLLHVEGSLRTRSWEDSSGTKRYATEIQATEVIFLQTRKEQTAVADSTPASSPQAEATPVPLADTPF